MGFFGLFKAKPVQPKAPQFVPPPAPDRPPDLLEEFSEHLEVPSQVPDARMSPPAPDFSAPASSEFNFTVPSPASPESLVDVSDDELKPPTSDTSLPDFSDDEINSAKKLEERAKKLFSPGWLTPQDEPAPAVAESSWETPPDEHSFFGEPAAQPKAPPPEFQMPEELQNTLGNLTVEVPHPKPAPRAKMPEFTQSHSEEESSEWEVTKPEKPLWDRLPEPKEPVTPPWETTSENVEEPLEEPSFEEPLPPEPQEAQKMPWEEEPLPEAIEETFSDVAEDRPPWEETPLPELPEITHVEEKHTEEPEHTLPVLDGDFYLPVLQYRDALEQMKSLKNDLKMGNTRLVKTLHYMDQQKTKLAEFAQDLRAIEVELLRMDELLR